MKSAKDTVPARRPTGPWKEPGSATARRKKRVVDKYRKSKDELRVLLDCYEKYNGMLSNEIIADLMKRTTMTKV